MSILVKKGEADRNQAPTDSETQRAEVVLDCAPFRTMQRVRERVFDCDWANTIVDDPLRHACERGARGGARGCGDVEEVRCMDMTVHLTDAVRLAVSVPDIAKDPVAPSGSN